MSWTENIEGHHASYEKPHEVMSLCNLHHKAVDLVGDKLGFDLPVIDISIYFKKDKRTKVVDEIEDVIRERGNDSQKPR